jgi:hypothetical protein
MKWNWIPNVSVGLLKLNRSVSISELQVECHIVDDYGYQKVYELRKEKVRFTVERDIVVSVELFGSVYYQDRELIGMSIDELKCLFDLSGCEKKENEEFGSQIMCDELGVIFWEEKKRVESITVY